jgi:hypothetical protein
MVAQTDPLLVLHERTWSVETLLGTAKDEVSTCLKKRLDAPLSRRLLPRGTFAQKQRAFTCDNQLASRRAVGAMDASKFR